MSCKNHPEEVVGLNQCVRCGHEFCANCLVELKGKYYCAACKVEQVRDIQSGADTSQLELASITRRFGALILDGMLMMVLFIAIIIPVTASGLADPNPGTDRYGRPNPPVNFIILIYGVFLGGPFVYESLMLSRRGQTLGKMAAGIKVVTPEGEDITSGQAWLRTGMKVILGLFYYITFIAALFSKEKKALHDSIARTRVIRLQ